jgi:hypothetical protein
MSRNQVTMPKPLRSSPEKRRGMGACVMTAIPDTTGAKAPLSFPRPSGLPDRLRSWEMFQPWKVVSGAK